MDAGTPVAPAVDSGVVDAGSPYSYAWFEFAPPTGLGMPAECSDGGVFGVLDGGQAMVALTFTRASVAECISSDGQIVTQVAANTPAVSSWRAGDTTKALHVDSVGAANSSMQSRDLSQAVWVKTFMTCTRTATGMRGGDINGASTCTATLANGSVTQIVVASGLRNSSFHIKRRTGTGVIEVTRDGTGWTDITSRVSSSAWRRVVAYETYGCAGGNCIVVESMSSAMTNPVFGVRLVTSGDAVDVDFVQDEPGKGASLPIETAATAVSRAAESGYFTVPATSVRALGVDFAYNGYGYLTGGFRSVLAAWTDASNITSLWLDSGGSGEIVCAPFVGGVLQSATGFSQAPLTASGLVQWSCSHAASSSITVKQRDRVDVIATALPVLTGATRVYLGDSPLAGASKFPSVYRNVCVSDVVGRCDRSTWDTSDYPLAAVGDSITEGVHQLPSRWVTRLGIDQVRPTYSAAISGVTAASCLSNYQTTVVNHGYSGVVVICGVNSLIGGDTGSSIFSTLKQIFDDVRARGMRLTIGTILPWGSYGSWSEPKQVETLALNGALLAYCSDAGVTCVDFYNSVLRVQDGGTALDPRFSSADNIHPNPDGGMVMTELWKAANP